MSNKVLWLAVTSTLAACPSLSCCVFGFSTLAGATTYETEVGGMTSTGTLDPAWGILLLCLAIVPWFLPAGVWFYLNRKEKQMASPSVGSTWKPQ